MSRRDRQRVENPLGNTRFSAKAYLYLLPAFAVLGVFVFYPIVKTLRMGFYESYVYLTDTGKGLGLASFAYVLKDPAFRLALRNTLIIVAVGVPITIVLALGSALFINSLRKGRGVFQTIYFLPYVTSTIAIGLVFRWLFHSDYGYINYFLSFLGVAPQKWLTAPNLTIVSVTIFTVWNGLAFKIVLFLAGSAKDRPPVLSGGPHRRNAAAPGLFPHHHAAAVIYLLDGSHHLGDPRLQDL